MVGGIAPGRIGGDGGLGPVAELGVPSGLVVAVALFGFVFGRHTAAPDLEVFRVVGEGVALGEPPRAVDQREHERRDAEGDDDRGEHERLREGIGEVDGRGLSVDDRRGASTARHDQDQDVRGVADEEEPEQHARHAAFEQQVHAARVERGHHDDEDERDAHARPPSVGVGPETETGTVSSTGSDTSLGWPKASSSS
nr:hypothetical protein GCM10025699_47130 [Microbacterium flavescens]